MAWVVNTQVAVLSLVRNRAGSDLYRFKKKVHNRPDPPPAGARITEGGYNGLSAGYDHKIGLADVLSQVSVVAGKLGLPWIWVFAGLPKRPGGGNFNF